jgi:hypothetical protein
MNDNENLERQALLLLLMKALWSRDSWCGETHVQKTTFFLDELTNHNVGYSFILYKHGPYSFQLSEDLSMMEARQFLEDKIVSPSYGPRLKPNPAAEVLLSPFGRRAQGLRDAISFVVDKLSDCSVATLERLGTALYVTQRENLGDAAARARRIHQVKPHVSETQALDAVNRVDAILKEWTSRTSTNAPTTSAC